MSPQLGHGIPVLLNNEHVEGPNPWGLMTNIATAKPTTPSSARIGCSAAVVTPEASSSSPERRAKEGSGAGFSAGDSGDSKLKVGGAPGAEWEP